MLPTPDTSHVSFDTIYEPAEDSFLLLDTLSAESETAWLFERFRHRVPCLIEVGPGSGVVIAFLTANARRIFGQPVISLGIDVNVNACKAASQTAAKAIRDQGSDSCYLGSLCSDLFASLQPNSADVVVFNPPYVPSEELPALPHIVSHVDSFERDSHLLALSYAGGEEGMETTNRFIAGLPNVLSPVGIAYLLLCAQNKPDEVKRRIEQLPRGPWLTETVGRSGKKAGWEKLQIVRIWREISDAV